MTNVAITGASGTVGREAIAAFSDRDETLTLFSHSETEGLETTPVDITERQAVFDALEGQDVVIHLAANPDPRAEWDTVSGPNVEGCTTSTPLRSRTTSSVSSLRVRTTR